jgi:hypothetical protein
MVFLAIQKAAAIIRRELLLDAGANPHRASIS